MDKLVELAKQLRELTKEEIEHRKALQEFALMSDVDDLKLLVETIAEIERKIRVLQDEIEFVSRTQKLNKTGGN